MEVNEQYQAEDNNKIMQTISTISKASLSKTKPIRMIEFKVKLGWQKRIYRVIALPDSMTMAKWNYDG